MRRRGIKENVGGFYLTQIYCSPFVNVTIYPQYNKHKENTKMMDMMDIHTIISATIKHKLNK